MRRILVCGDVMLDRFLFGEVSRLSQEAPVPVVRYLRDDCRLGAAANVAHNCVTLGAQTTLIGAAGRDEGADLIMSLIEKAGINAFILTDPNIKTTQKMRVIGRNQQIVRVDYEDKPTFAITEKALEQIRDHDIIVFSDYDKGALVAVAEMVAHAKALGKMVLVDPKGFAWGKYAGADLIKPNKDEIRAMAGAWSSEEELSAKVDQLRAGLNVKAILVTQAADGMTLYDGRAIHIPSKAEEVFDVTGAGDTVIAAMAVALAEGASLIEAAKVANHAAGVAVSKFGTHAVTIDELQGAIWLTR